MTYVSETQYSTKKFTILIVAIQLLLWYLIALDYIGLQIPLIRQLISFVYLTFVPGILLLRILNLTNINYIEKILFEVGLSISFLMLSGFFINYTYPLVGIAKPIALIPLIATISSFIILLIIIVYIKEIKYPVQKNTFKLDFKQCNYTFFLCMILLSTIFGVYFVNVYNINYILMFILLLISLIPLLVVSNNLPEKLYPLAIFIIAISLIYHTSLNSMYLWGRDIFNEYYISNIVINASIWNPAIGDNVNSVLSITLLPSIYSYIGNISLTWVFKAIYPFIYSVSIIGLYRIFEKQTNNKIAFLSCFFFVSVYTFYAEMPQLARQEIAELFLVILILLLIDTNLNKMKKSILTIVFTISLVISHYGTVFLFLFTIISATIVIFIFNFLCKIITKNKYTGDDIKYIRLNYIFFYSVFVFVWYIFVSNQPFISIIHLLDSIISSIIIDSFNPLSTETVNMIMRQQESTTITLLKYLHFITQFFIFIGIVTSTIDYKKKSFDVTYIALSFINLGFCASAFIVPNFASALTTPRLYHLTLIFLAPFCVIGGLKVLSIIKKVESKNALYILAIFLGIFLLFNSGFVGEFTKDRTSISLDSSSDWPKYNQKEFTSAKWLNTVKNDSIFMYGDTYRWILIGSFDWNKSIEIKKDLKLFTKKSYVYLGSENVNKGQMILGGGRFSNGVYVDYGDLIINKDKIYDNSGAQIYYS